ncbi:MAG TPA: group II intron reverse transcriptase/maturase [Acidimicrobiales bacterium]|nr:group II intron reverse transcriptase/maturase [Acidimicrobiales bacterium]
MTETQSSQDVSTKLERIAKLAKSKPGTSLLTLAHHIDVDWLREAYRRTRKDGARGVDGQSAKQYAAQLDMNLQSLLDRAKSGSYRAPPVRRVHIPKGDGTESRPIGIPTFEDKVLQRAVAMVIGEVYEQEFHDFSYGFRPGRSAHQAVEAIQKAAWRMCGGWLVEVDIKKFFDTVDHAFLRDILRQRIGDGVLLRLIGKWLNAGVVEGLVLSYPDEGTPQGGVISPLLANIYLHTVLDGWFVRDVQPALARKAEMVRYADDFVVLFESKHDAERFLAVLPKRFGKYGLTLHPDKTRMVSFRRPDRVDNDDDGPGTFDFLGFTHYWAVSRNGNWCVKQRTAKDRLTRALHRLRDWCRWNRHRPLKEQHRKLKQKLNGHYAYYGITSNFDRLAGFYYLARRAWHAALTRRSQRRLSWATMLKLLERFPLPAPRIVHRYGT